MSPTSSRPVLLCIRRIKKWATEKKNKGMGNAFLHCWLFLRSLLSTTPHLVFSYSHNRPVSPKTVFRWSTSCWLSICLSSPISFIISSASTFPTFAAKDDAKSDSVLVKIQSISLLLVLFLALLCYSFGPFLLLFCSHAEMNGAQAKRRQR